MRRHTAPPCLRELSVDIGNGRPNILNLGGDLWWRAQPKCCGLLFQFVETPQVRALEGLKVCPYFIIHHSLRPPQRIAWDRPRMKECQLYQGVIVCLLMSPDIGWLLISDLKPARNCRSTNCWCSLQPL
jgi:hypothetical protein